MTFEQFLGNPKIIALLTVIAFGIVLLISHVVIGKKNQVISCIATNKIKGRIPTTIEIDQKGKYSIWIDGKWIPLSEQQVEYVKVKQDSDNDLMLIIEI